MPKKSTQNIPHKIPKDQLEVGARAHIVAAAAVHGAFLVVPCKVRVQWTWSIHAPMYSGERAAILRSMHRKGRVFAAILCI